MALEDLPCGCKDTVRTMGTMVRDGRRGRGHYAQDGDYMGQCTRWPGGSGRQGPPAPECAKPTVRKVLTDEELDAFIEDADQMRPRSLSRFFDEVIGVANELKEWREANARTDR